METYNIPIERLKKAGINPEIGRKVLLTLKDGMKVTAKITKIEKETAVVTSG